MLFTNLLVLSTILYFASSATANPDKAYLYINGTLPNEKLGCYNLPSNTQCPSTLINYKVFGFGFNDALAQNGLKSIELVMKTLDFFSEVTQSCKDDLREYACSNSFAQCVKDDTQTYGVAMSYNITRTEQACARVKKSCPLDAQTATINNCSTIMKNFMDFAYCVHVPDSSGDICPNSGFKHPKVNVNFYPILVRQLNYTLDKLAPIFSVAPPVAQCREKFIDINCQLLYGPICSTDDTLRMLRTSEQDCASTVNNCIPSFIPRLQSYFLEMCKLFPDRASAKMVPLPPHNVIDNDLL